MAKYYKKKYYRNTYHKKKKSTATPEPKTNSVRYRSDEKSEIYGTDEKFQYVGLYSLVPTQTFSTTLYGFYIKITAVTNITGTELYYVFFKNLGGQPLPLAANYFVDGKAFPTYKDKLLDGIMILNTTIPETMLVHIFGASLDANERRLMLFLVKVQTGTTTVAVDIRYTMNPKITLN